MVLNDLCTRYRDTTRFSGCCVCLDYARRGPDAGCTHPSWVATRRGLHKPVSSSPPLKTVRTTFMVYGLAPAVPLRDPRSVPSHFASSTGVHPWTACAFAGYLCSGLSTG